MNHKPADLAKLQDLAQLRSDIEMRRFSVYRAHVAAAQSRIADIRGQLQDLYESDAAFSVAQARLANALAGDHARALSRAEADLARIMQGFMAARTAAIREFGRLRVLDSLHADALDQRKQKIQRDLDGG